MVDTCFQSQVIRPSGLPSGIPGTASPAKETSGPTVFSSSATSFVKTSVTGSRWLQSNAPPDKYTSSIHLQLATLRDKVRNKIALDIPSLQLATQQNISLQFARKVEASCTFRDVARQSAACDMAIAACHATLTSTLRDTLQEMLHPCDTTFRYDGKGWNILEAFDRTG